MPHTVLAGFFALAFGLTWACWLPLALLDGGLNGETGLLLLYAGSLGPLLATLIALGSQGQRENRARWRRRLVNVGALASPAGILAVALPILIAQLAQSTYVMTAGIALPEPGMPEILGLLVPTVLFGALPQELAWRGHALPVLARGRGPLVATLVVAAAWGAWQLPLFFIDGTYQAGIEPGSVAGAMYFLDLAGQSVLMTTLYLATRCTWAAVLFHGMTVLIGEAWQLPVDAEIHRSLWTLLAAGVALLLKPPFGMRGN
jgi:membrane protease YdiL (CAAX protease family)